MAIDFLALQASKPSLASQRVRAANLTKELRELIDGLNDAANHMHDGANFAMVETQFSLAAGTGGNFVTMLQQQHDIYNTAAEVTGANRLSRLDEFVARQAGQ